MNALVLENQPPGTSVLRVLAHDADTGVNGEVKYGIMQRDGASPGFTINPDTGTYCLLYQIALITHSLTRQLSCWLVYEFMLFISINLVVKAIK